MDNDIKLVTNGTDNHMLLIDLTPFGGGKGLFVQDRRKGCWSIN